MSHAGSATLINILERRAEASPDLRVLTFFADGETASASLTPAQLIGGLGMQLLWIALGVGLVQLIWRAGVGRFTAVGG